MFGWLALKDVPLREVQLVLARANWVLLLGLSIPSYALVIYLRALRWRHLTDPIQPIAPAPLLRAVAVGFTVNNILPLRMGEIVRAWYLSHEVGASPTAVFGTVILERVIDIVCVIGLAGFVLAIWGGDRDGRLAEVAIAAVLIAWLAIAGLVVLRVAPRWIIRVARWLLQPLPEPLTLRVTRALRRISEGLGALRGGVHLFWIAAHSLAIWLIASTLPMLAGIWALGIDLGTPLLNLEAAWMILVAVGLAVAIPSAPGFFGTYHYACRLALEQFGVSTETAVALGTLVHATFWIGLTLPGLVILCFAKVAH